MCEDFFNLRPRILFGFVAGLIVILSFAGCSKKNGQAVVLEKEHIAAREITPTPKTEPSASPTEPAASSDASTPSEEVVREMREGEIDVDGYVMKRMCEEPARIRGPWTTNDGSSTSK